MPAQAQILALSAASVTAFLLVLNLLAETSQIDTVQWTQLSEYNGLERLPPSSGVDKDDGWDLGWEQHRLDFDKRWEEIQHGENPDFNGWKNVQDNINRKGRFSRGIYNDQDYSWTESSHFGPGHWDYARVMNGFDEKPVRDGTGKGCNGPPPNGQGCIGKLQDKNPPTQCDPVLGCVAPWNKWGGLAEGENLDKKGVILPSAYLAAARTHTGMARIQALAAWGDPEQ